MVMETLLAGGLTVGTRHFPLTQLRFECHVVLGTTSSSRLERLQVVHIQEEEVRRCAGRGKAPPSLLSSVVDRLSSAGAHSG